MSHAKLSLVPVVDEQFVITANATTAPAGDFTLTVEGQETAVIVFDAAAAVILAALELLSTVPVGSVTVTDGSGGISDANGTATIDFVLQLGALPVILTADFTGLTGNTHVLTNPANGVANKLVDTLPEDTKAQYLIQAVSLKMGSTGGIVTFKSRNVAISSAMELAAADHVVLPFNPEGWFQVTVKGEDLEIGLSAGDGDIDIVYKKLQ